MNLINKFFLKLALLPSPVYRKMGVDLAQLRAILETKLTMDDRRPSAMYQVQRKKDKPVKAATIMTIVFSAFMGLFFLLAFSFGTDMLTQLTIYFSLLFVMLSATLISDFTSVLIDIRDSFIILPKPVSDKTFVISRLLHIFIHICKILLPMSLPGLIYVATTTSFGSGLFFLLLVFFVAIFSIFFINAVYLLILKITTPQKFQSIISYIQIIFAIVVYGSYQVIPRIMGRLEMEDFQIDSIRGIMFYPMYWFAGAWSIFSDTSGDSMHWISLGLALLLPIASLFIVVKYLAPSFNNKLAMINNSGPEKPAGIKKPVKSRRSSYPEVMAGLLTRNTTERTAFLITWKISSRSRDFKLKVYPGIGYLAVYIFIIFWNSARESFDNLQDDSMTSRVIILSFLYFTTMILTMAMNQMTYSDKYKASWIYYITPIGKPGEVILGAAKSLMMKFYFPVAIFISIAGIYFLGLVVIPHIILGVVNVLLITAIISISGSKFFPFSRAQNNNANAGSFIRNIFMLLIGGLIGVLHFFLYSILPVIIIFIFLSAAALWLITANIRNTTWASIKSEYAGD